ncbi:selenide, water dikinase SelD [Synechococcus sp. M16CYN]|uniref:selenide, water dikinase SelD n=1 Tax=Synechococcus sp. M16CYN TaxID=3103139 RepID=UPI0032555D92
MNPLGPLLLAGGGHSHTLLLKRWAMTPRLRPKCGIVLVNRHPTTLYSSMVPGLIANIYSLDEISIDLRNLCDRAGVAFVQAEITGADPHHRYLNLYRRPALRFGLLSLDVGAVIQNIDGLSGFPIRPLETALSILSQQDPLSRKPFRVVGGGFAGVEVVLALRHRWPHRPLHLHTRVGQLNAKIRGVLQRARVCCLTNLRNADNTGHSTLLCTGSQAPSWLAESGFAVNKDGRVYTDAYLQLKDYPNIFASGDCAVVVSQPRPASGVWAVKAAKPLARNLEAAYKGQSLHPWKPQRQALQLIGDQNGAAWLQRGRLQIGPSHMLWVLKQTIDHAFMAGFARPANMNMRTAEAIACRGCAAKLPARLLGAALSQVGLDTQPEDAIDLGGTPALLQSVDGFPALLSDPWLNARLTALHACSDLWACGATVTSAMAVVTLPSIHPIEQQEMLAQTLEGIQSVLNEQGATLIGGHTLESRSPIPTPTSLGIQVALSVNGQSSTPWSKGGIQIGDALLLNRALGTGVLFAAAMVGAAKPRDIEAALSVMNSSQHQLISTLRRYGPAIHACTDITGFGLLGHLTEMLQGSKPLTIQLWTNLIPVHQGAMDLLEKGFASSLAPSNREAWNCLNGPVQLIPASSRAMMNLLVDPQTCGPLLVACTAEAAASLTAEYSWIQIGIARADHV